MKAHRASQRRPAARETVADLKRRLRLLEKRHELVMGAINEGVYDWNVLEDSIDYSPGVQRAVGLPGKIKTLADWRDRIHPQDLPRYLAGIVEHFKQKTERFQCDYRYRASDGRWRWARQHGIAVRDRRGRAVRMIGATGDITALKLAEMEKSATAEILRIMATSPGDAQPVFDAIARNAAALCDALFAVLFRYDGKLVHFVAHHNFPAAALEQARAIFPMPADDSRLSGRALNAGSVQRLEDVLLDGAYDERLARAGGWRRMVAVPMVRHGRALGTINVAWMDPGPIPDDLVALLHTFADQAVIAMESVRLFDETREALERQTATADILRVMSGSPTDVQPVFDAIVRSGLRLFRNAAVTVAVPQANEVHLRAIAEHDPARAKQWAERFPFPLTREYMHGVALLDCTMVDMPDVEEMDAAFGAGKRNFSASGYRAMTVVPMAKNGVAIGTIAVVRAAPGPLGEKQIQLLKTFADQAVIAIENVRLFNEIRESLDQQKASGEVLRAISHSISDTAPVFDKILESCQRLFEGTIVGLNLLGPDGNFHMGAFHGAQRQEFQRTFPYPNTGESGSGLSVLERRVVHYLDAQDGDDVPARTRHGCRTLGIRSIIFAPVLWEGHGLGAIFVGRDRASAFSDKEIGLLRTFADQAAIAIENVRLFNETREALEQQTATAEILRTMSTSPNDVGPVFETILENAVRLGGGPLAAIFRYDGTLVHMEATRNWSEQALASMRAHYPAAPNPHLMSGRVILSGKVQQQDDALSDPGYDHAVARASGWRRMLGVPLLREGAPIGAFVVAWPDPGRTPERLVSLLEAFAQQAVIAIENVRLFREIQEKSRQLEVASRHKSEFLANMSHELRTPLNAIIGFTRIVMRRSKEALEAKQYENLEKILASGQHLLALINAILDLSKIEAGHTDVVPAETELAPVLEQCLRTVEPLVKVALVREFNGALPRLYVDEEKLRQIVINLLSNAAKFTERGAIRLQARAQNGSISIAVADTGIGIPADKLGMIFEEFEQVDASSTRAHGGSGLGLAIARRLAHLMGGDIGVESAPGHGSTFTLTLPLRYAR